MDSSTNDFADLLKPDGSGPCPGCGEEVQFFIMFGQRKAECGPCAEAEKAKRIHKRRVEDAVAVWQLITPPSFRVELDPSRIHRHLLPALDYDPLVGAGLTGATGAGKTRVAYQLLRMAARKGKKPFACTHAEYRQAVANRHHNDATIRGEATHLIQLARHSAALLIDDVGKAASTKSETGEEALYDLLNERRDNNRLTFWTANGGSKWLSHRLGPDYGPAIIRRLADLTKPLGAKAQILTVQGDE